MTYHRNAENRKYRLPASNDTDAAWWKLVTESDAGEYLLSKQEGEISGLDPSRHIYLDRPDLGYIGYIVEPLAAFEMHCLNMPRM